MRQIFNYFLIGVLAFIPIVVILQIVWFVKDRFADLFRMVYGYYENYGVTFSLFVVSFALFAYVGYRVSLGRFSIIAGIDAVIHRIPLLNTIYRVTKKLVNMLSGHEKHKAREVVYIEYPKEGLWVPAYVTNRENDRYILFVPTSPNPTSGFTLIAHESRVHKSQMNIEQATSFIISIGSDYDKAIEANDLPK
nr:DUF502 domain-containing protein [Methylomarinum sp. Ch1-1]MDP4522389.1 DUF502 domain-containing protein [Methylomarinum sp. Ch1-1]